ncbi:hypothetical protein J2S10_004435 [Neobacillus ginsengisoli]|uniref:HTH-like domain-containing protein n=1 Tax=Neobacillus ginsengisoli TaxID=904295 RepID=A0ABT9Y075_9BACI|nr:hypothetical protein [Neobacillus ginsengisoli]
MIKNNRQILDISNVRRPTITEKYTYYYEAKEQSNSGEELTAAIVEIFHKSRQNYGIRKIKHELKKLGMVASR